ncbi:hypothetical protein SLS60_000716 [Paraconiothyrium brasiliense]|uniref:Uncharacterized protein n=1 Tax=Paraconiothyrium brasiliense TaxID=300254 RepID=A0ABR3S710_9PLEO
MRWMPSEEELARISRKTEDNREERGEIPTRGVRGGLGVGEETVVHMRGGGIQEFFGLKRPNDTKSLPQRPEIIRRPSDAFDRTGRPSEAAINPGTQCFEGQQATLVRPQNSQLLRVQQMKKLAPPSLFSNEGLSEMADSGKTASIVPEGSIASFYVGSQTRPATLHASSDSRDSRVSLSYFPSPPPLVAGDHNEPFPEKPPTTGSDQSESTICYWSPTVEISATELQRQWNSGSPALNPLRSETNGVRTDKDPTNERRGEENRTVRKLRSPLQSPIPDARDRSQVESHSSPSNQSGSQSPPSEYLQDPQITFVGTPTRGDLGRSIEGSLRKHRRTLGQSQVANPPQHPTAEQTGRPYLFPPSSALSSDIALPPDIREATETMNAEPSNRSVWQGGGHLSIAPEDSASEAGVRAQLRGQTGSKQHRGREAKLFPGEALTEVGEGHETEEEAKEKSEARFRDEVRKAWSSYQTRMRMINEDMGKTPNEKERVRRHGRRQALSFH